MLSKLTKDPLGLITTIMLDFHRGWSTNGIYNHLVTRIQLRFWILNQLGAVVCSKKTSSTIFLCMCCLFLFYMNEIAFWGEKVTHQVPFSSTSPFSHWIHLMGRPFPDCECLNLFVCPAFKIKSPLEEDFCFVKPRTFIQNHYSCSFAYSSHHYY